MITFRAPGTLADRLDRLDNKTDFIRGSLRRSLDTYEAGPADMGTMVPAEALKNTRIPYFDQRVVAGFPVPLDNDERSQDIDIISMLCPHLEASYLIRVQGDSMIDAGIQSGDIVIVDKSNRNPTSREIAVCELNGEFTLKHFVREGSEGWLVPANPEYPRLKITSEDEFSIWGTVTYIIHKARD